jgi:hypothetical protein
MSRSVSTLLLRNLDDIFGEIDPARRRAAIDEIFHEDAVFYDPKGGLVESEPDVAAFKAFIQTEIGKNSRNSLLA